MIMVALMLQPVCSYGKNRKEGTQVTEVLGTLNQVVFRCVYFRT